MPTNTTSSNNSEATNEAWKRRPRRFIITKNMYICSTWTGIERPHLLGTLVHQQTVPAKKERENAMRTKKKQIAWNWWKSKIQKFCLRARRIPTEREKRGRKKNGCLNEAKCFAIEWKWLCVEQHKKEEVNQWARLRSMVPLIFGFGSICFCIFRDNNAFFVHCSSDDLNIYVLFMQSWDDDACGLPAERPTEVIRTHQNEAIQPAHVGLRRGYLQRNRIYGVCTVYALRFVSSTPTLINNNHIKWEGKQLMCVKYG